MSVIEGHLSDFVLFCSCDLDVEPMTLICELDLNVLKVNMLTKTELSR